MQRHREESDDESQPNNKRNRQSDLEVDEPEPEVEPESESAHTFDESLSLGEDFFVTSSLFDSESDEDENEESVTISNLIRESELADVVQVRSGLFCIRSKWAKSYFYSSESPYPMKWATEFNINNCLYKLNAYFMKNSEIGESWRSVLAMKLEQLEAVSNSGEKLSTSNEQRPASIVWVPLWQDKVYPFEKDLVPNRWTMGPHVFEFSYPKKCECQKLLDYSIWIQFDIVSDGEKNVLEQLADMFLQQKYCDVDFVFEGDHRIGGHVNVLSARSPVFAAMFQHGMMESNTGQVFIRDVELDTFKQLLYYIYSGRIEKPLTVVTAQSIYLAADQYDIADLKKECLDFLVNSVLLDNVIDLLVWTNFYSIDQLKEFVLNFMAKHGKEICLLDGWTDFTQTYPDLCDMVTKQIVKYEHEAPKCNCGNSV